MTSEDSWQTILREIAAFVCIVVTVGLIIVHFFSWPSGERYPNIAFYSKNGESIDTFRLCSRNGRYRVHLGYSRELTCWDVEEQMVIWWLPEERVLGKLIHLTDDGKWLIYEEASSMTPPPKEEVPVIPIVLTTPFRNSDSCIMLRKHDTLYGRFTLISGNYTAAYQADNNLVVYDNRDSHVVWCSRTEVKPASVKGMKRTEDGDWFIGNHQIWIMPALPDFNTLCLSSTGNLVRAREL
jgi:hypothetical protein